MPLNGLFMGAKVNADARTTLHLSKVRDMVVSAANAAGILVPRAVQPMLVGIRSIHLRADKSARINIELGGTVPVLQLLPVAEDSGNATADTTTTAAADAETLTDAAASGDAAGVAGLLGRGVAVDGGQDALGRTALHRASLNGHLEVVKNLLGAKASLNAVDCDGGTALMAAAQSGMSDIVKTLVNSGADILTKVLPSRTVCIQSPAQCSSASSCPGDTTDAGADAGCCRTILVRLRSILPQRRVMPPSHRSSRLSGVGCSRRRETANSRSTSRRTSIRKASLPPKHSL